MPTAMDVANYFLAANPPLSLTDLKLQKLCSYAQAIAVAYIGRPIFRDSIEMWELGPVVPSVYKKYSKYSRNPIPQAERNHSVFSAQERLVLAAVNDHYSRLFDAWGLCEQSHRDFPGVRGSNITLDENILRHAFEENLLVQRLQKGDEGGSPDSNKTLSEREFWNAVSN